MGVFGGIKESKYSEGGVYVLPGVYKVAVTACKHIKTRKGQEAFVVEMLVQESNNPERMPGSSMSWMVTMDKEPALGNIKQFLKTILEAEEDQIDESVVLYAVDEKENPLAGKEVRISATNITTKSNRPFTKCKFMPATLTSAEAAAEHAKG